MAGNDIKPASEVDLPIQAKLARAMLNMSNPKKNTNNPYFNSTYANLESVSSVIKDALEDEGLVFMQRVSGGIQSTLTLTVMDSSGSSYEMERRPFEPTGTIQQQGSYETYMRRYQLMTCFGLAPTEDDDGNAANEAPDYEDIAKKVAWAEMKKAESAYGVNPDNRPPFGSVMDVYLYIASIEKGV